MSSKDKTRQKLMGSMRKTKAVAGIGADQANTGPVIDASKKTVTAKTVTEREVESGAPSRDKLRGGDGYQSKGRVWPD